MISRLQRSAFVGGALRGVDHQLLPHREAVLVGARAARAASASSSPSRLQTRTRSRVISG